MSKIGIQSAMPVELENFVKVLGAKEIKEKGFYRLYTALFGGHELFLACSGIGKVNAAACAQKLIDGCGVDYIINMGIAGGISEKLHTLDIVIGRSVKYHDFTPDSLLEKYYPFQKSFDCDETLRKAAKKACEKLAGVRYLSGDIASGDCFVESGEVKRRIRDELGCLCCEMEGAAIGHVCALNRVGFLILRSISDLADEDAGMSYAEFEEKASRQANDVVLGMLEAL